MKWKKILISLTLFSSVANHCIVSASVPKQWSEALLFSIRNDLARPPVHARNLYHLSMAMHDAWAAYQPGGETVFLGKTIGSYTSDFFGVQTIQDSAQRAAKQEEAISYAAYRLIKHRFVNAPGAFFISQYIDSLMTELGYSTSVQSTDYVADGPAALGNYIAQEIINFGYLDGSNESGNFVYQYYTPANPPIPVEQPGNPSMVDPNRWQPISLTNPIDQAGNPLPSTPLHLGPEWGNVTPFALKPSDITYHVRDGHTYQVYHDPGAPPFYDTIVQSGMEDFFKWNYVLVSIWQSHLDPDDPTLWDISPSSIGNITNYPTSWNDYDSFYDLTNGGDPGTGHSINPITGLPYTPQLVKRSDYGRVLAEFWADGIDSETPPGHWFDIYNHISEHPMFERKWKGVGPELSLLDYDVKAYLVLGSAMHDAAISAWGIKGWYDSPRPVSIIRYMADKGQSTDNMASNYHPAGIPLVPGYVETVEVGDPLAGSSNEHVGKIKLYTWRGHEYINDPETEHAGVGWILAENWWPYQRPSFVSPPFAGYVSGHSTYSSAAAEVLSFITGSEYFPGGLGEFVAQQNEFLEFEEGPTETIVLQWATYKDAADQCSLSRIWGGIHPPVDDIPGRIIGATVGEEVALKADSIFAIKRPTVVNVLADQSIITIDDFGTQMHLSVEYDSIMNTSVLPQVEYLVNDPSAVISFVSSTWDSDHVYTLTFDIMSVSAELDSIYLLIDSAISTYGIYQQTVTCVPVFEIDTKAPEIVSVTQNLSAINSTMDGTQLILTIDLSEPCQSIQPLLEIDPSAPLGADLSLSPMSGWVDNDTYEAVFDIDVLTEATESIVISASHFIDLAGNTIVANSHVSDHLIDTDLPDLTSWLSNIDSINMWNEGSGVMEMTISFDEPMATGSIPAVHFIDASLSIVTLPLYQNNSLSNWATSSELHILLDVDASPFVHFEGLTAVLSVVSDTNGNQVNELGIPIELGVDNIRPEVLTITPLHSIIDEQVYQNDETYITIVFSEKMDVNVIPIVECMKDQMLVTDLIFDPFNSSWLDEYTYYAHFDLPQADFYLEDVSVVVSYALDAFGNQQFEFESMPLMDFDYLLDQSSVTELKEDISVYPNPVISGEMLRINCAEKQIEEVILTDLFGKQVGSWKLDNSKTEVKILIDDKLASGIYFLHIEIGGVWLEQRISILE